ncbi:DNA polymerase III alpha subunit [Hymenobacter sp. 9A]|uniref:DNA polymerase III subunit alpha n=1 Tax=Hymenobacter caeli TaxID=2735894 RepID=A0ABX2FU50_9BACT|nr:DNA polymerase III alpha subunit [Hymenobacter caeli]
MPVFSHLHSHTQYSLLDGQASIGALMKKAQADGMPAVALTDHGNMFGAFNFVAEANKYNVKPIVGCEFYLVEDRHKKAFSREKGERDVRHHQLLLAKDQAGYHNLSKLCSLSFIEGSYSKFPRIDKELLEQYHEGLIATSCCIGAEIPQTILFRSETEAEEKLKWWLNMFGDDYYIEIQRHGLMNFDGTGKSQEDVNQVLLRLAHKHGVKVICTNDSHYVDQTDFAAHDLLLCVNTGEEHSIPVGDIRTNYYTLLTSDGTVRYDLLDNLRQNHGRDERAQKQLRRIDEELQKPKPHTRFGFANDQFYFKKQAEMNALFADVPESVDNTNEIVDKITPPKLARDILLPNFPLPAQFANADDFLRDLTFKGAFEGPKPRYSERTAEVEERLNYELRIIQTMGFAGYFLITQDFINHGRSVGVAVGPGRGSAAGSAVAYCVGITNIDPIKYSLLFERFLNPERVSMPDIDIDFDDVNRQKVIDYVVQKYGKTQVAQIITFGTMAAKSSIKDVARAMELPLPQTNDLTKMVPEQVGTTLAKAFAENMELDMIRRDEHPDNLKGQILRLAVQLEGSVRNTGIHAAGVIIAPDDITKYIPVSTSKDSDLLVTQFDGKVIESAGMLKMDFLGLKTLTIIVDAMRLIERNHGVKIDIDEIPLDDEKTYALYQRGDTIGTFQFESEGMRQHLKDLKPTNIEDLIAMNALYRPGPMQFIPNFINRKHGREPIEYPHELLEPILKNSQGICVTGDTLVHDADTGARVRIDQLAGRVGSFRVQGVDTDLRPAVAPVTHFFDNGVRDVVRVRLRDGSCVTMTPDHQVLTESGWQEIQRLGVGSFIATPRRLDVGNEADYDLSKLRTLAYLLADGSLTSGACCDFVSQSPALVAEYTRCVHSFENLTVSTFPQVRDVTRVSVKVADKAHYHEPTTLLTWLRALGLKTQKGGLNSREKFVPEFVFGLSQECIAHFVASLWDCDGHVGEKICFYKTISPLLARDVQTLLLRLGLRSVVYETAYRNPGDATDTTAYQISTYQLRRFDAMVGPHLVEKRRAYDGPATPSPTDAVCRETFVAELRRAWPGSDKGLMRAHGFDRQHLLPARRARNPRVSAALVAPLTDVLALPATQRNLRVRWEEIVSIEPAGQQRVYDITVEGIHNFVGNNVLVHNCVYQEQIMQAAQIMAGYSLGGADLLRRAMGKKDMKKMALEREKFVKGAFDLHKVPAKKASEVFDVMEKFAEYGFNRSHSAAYSVVAYQTGYLKANYPAEYMAAVLTNNMGDIKKVTFFIEEARKQGVDVLGPDVNESLLKFNVNQEGKIRFGMAAVKGAGELAVETMVEEREKAGPYADIFDFAKRVNLRTVNKKTFESLAQAGAFDDFGKHRRLYLDAPAGDQPLIEKAMRLGQQHAAAKESSQHSLFGASAFGAVAAPLPKMHEMEPWTKTEQLRREKEVVGFYLSGHPLDSYKLELDAYCTCGLEQVEKHKNKEINVAGLITNVAFKTTKMGQSFATFTLEDYETSISPALFRDDYTRFAPLINPRNYANEQVPPMFVRLKQELRRGTQDQWDLRILNMQPLSEVAEKLSKGVRVRLDLRTVTSPMLDRLEAAIAAAPGRKRLEIQFAEPHEHLAVDMFSRKFQIEPKAFIEKMQEMEMDACQLI